MPEYRARLEVRTSGAFRRFSISTRTAQEAVTRARKAGASVVWIRRVKP